MSILLEEFNINIKTETNIEPTLTIIDRLKIIVVNIKIIADINENIILL